MADAGVLKSAQAGKRLWKQAGLHLLGDFKFLGSAALGFLVFGGEPALRFDRVSDFVEANQRKRVPVGIAEAAEDGSPNGRGVIVLDGSAVRKRRLHLQRVLESPEPRVGKKTDATLAPFTELCEDVFGDERDVRGASDLRELFGVGARNNQREVGGAVGRSDDDPPLTGLT